MRICSIPPSLFLPHLVVLVLQLRHVDVTAEDHKNHDRFIHVRSALSTHRTLLTSSGVVTLTLAPGRRRNFPLCHYSPSFPILPSLLSTRRPSIESPTDAAHCLRSADQRDHRCRNIFVEIILALSSLARTLASFSRLHGHSLLSPLARSLQLRFLPVVPSICSVRAHCVEMTDVFVSRSAPTV